MEVTDGRQIDEITEALADAGDPTGVVLQVGTRNAQNFELLKVVGQQERFPVLFKRGNGHHARGVAQRVRVHSQ